MLVFGYTIIQSKIFFYKVSKGNVPTLLINNHSIVGMKLVIVFKPPIAVKCKFYINITVIKFIL